MSHDIKLSGGEISVLKSLGFGGSPMAGKFLIDRAEMDKAELLDVIQGLVAQDYVVSSKVNIQTIDEIDRSFFKVNQAHAKELRDSTRPGRRDEDKGRRRRRG